MSLKLLCGCFCSKTAPRPYEDASADTTVLAPALKSAKTGVEVIMIHFTSLKQFCCASPQIHVLVLISRSRSGLVLSAKLGANLLNWLSIPRNQRNSVVLVGVGIV